MTALQAAVTVLAYLIAVLVGVLAALLLKQLIAVARPSPRKARS